MKQKYCKSAMNYCGGKYKLLPQIEPLFPRDIETFVDLFAGGLDVTINAEATHRIANDANPYVIEMYRHMQQVTTEELVGEIDAAIERFNLSKTNLDGFETLKAEYNRTRDIRLLYPLISHGFSNYFRFNEEGEYNNSFGKNRSWFNPRMRKNLIQMHPRMRDVEFCSDDFRTTDLTALGKNDFVYADPPYLISCGSYNDGNRGVGVWTQDCDKALFDVLDDLDRRGVRFALSNVTHHKGETNVPLIEWAGRYNVHELNFGYANASYQAKESATREVLVTNY